MNLKELAQTECSTEKLAPLARQIARTLIASLPAAEVIDISEHVNIVGGSTLPYLQRAAGEALIAAINEAGKRPKLVHALRTLPQQYMVHYQYIHHLCSIPLAASPGTSPHERGIAIDIQEHQSWIEVLKHHRWVWRGPADRPARPTTTAVAAATPEAHPPPAADSSRRPACQIDPGLDLVTYRRILVIIRF